jgi:hypothetical protein
LTTPTTFGTTDWQNAPGGVNPGFDLASGTKDNSFGQGTKTDSSNVSVVTGSIPNNKSDLTRFYEAAQVGSNSHNFLYLAFERDNVLGTANLNFEINQKTQPDLTATGAKTLVRTAGDLLVTYDFTNGGGRPTIGVLRWLTSSTVPVVPGFSTNSCFSANSFPCWGDQKVLNGADSIAAVNNLDAVSDPLFSSGRNYLASVPALQFGETAIDLTAAGVFPAGTCTAFGSTMATSRSSASFTSEVKDFIAPVPVNISNCASLTVIKHTEDTSGNRTGVDQNFGYTTTPTTGGLTPSTFTLNDGAGATGDVTCPATTGTCNTRAYTGVQPGTYGVTETLPVTNFSFVSLTCYGGSYGGDASHQTAITSGGTPSPTVSVTLAPEDSVVCTYTNQKQKTPSSVTTAPWYYPNDTATVSTSTQSNISGTVDFRLFGPTGGATAKTALQNCQADSRTALSTGLLYDSTALSLPTTPTTSASRNVSTDNHSVKIMDGQTYYWNVSYSGDTNSLGSSSACVENIAATLGTDPPPTP